MTLDRSRELLRAFVGHAELSESQLKLISIHLDLLLKWNAKISLTAIRDPEQIMRRHFGESLFVASTLLPKGAPRLRSAIDIGSGAGFPGLPLKIWDPELKLTLLESNHKKVAFLREAVRALGFSETEVLAVRAHEAAVCADLVTLRAVERFESILPVARKLLAQYGTLALLIGSAQQDAARSALRDLNWSSPILIPFSSNRVVMVGRS